MSFIGSRCGIVLEAVEHALQLINIERFLVHRQKKPLQQVVQQVAPGTGIAGLRQGLPRVREQIDDMTQVAKQFTIARVYGVSQAIGKQPAIHGITE